MDFVFHQKKEKFFLSKLIYRMQDLIPERYVNTNKVKFLKIEKHIISEKKK